MGNPGLVLQLFFHLSLQNLLFKSSKHTHVTPLLFQRHWLLVNFKVHFKILVLVLRALHGQAPSYNGDLLSPNTPSRSLRSSDQSLVVHNSLKTKSDRSLLLWPPNSGTLLLSLRSVDSVVYFKKKILCSGWLWCDLLFILFLTGFFMLLFLVGFLFFFGILWLPFFARHIFSNDNVPSFLNFFYFKFCCSSVVCHGLFFSKHYIHLFC